jgi:hypothetical protein
MIELFKIKYAWLKISQTYLNVGHKQVDITQKVLQRDVLTVVDAILNVKQADGLRANLIEQIISKNKEQSEMSNQQ